MKCNFAVLLAALACWALGFPAVGDEPSSSAPMPSVPDGFSIELVAGPPLVERPVVAAFDDDGRLYVAESSGSNDPVETQLAERPHSILRLEDDDGDGRFDRRTVFADRMMFPAGAMFLDGSLYVSAPPSIWKLTDADGDGVAEERVEWFQGMTLTGCANDLHGPYLGPDGWIYWCKGAFAEQTHQVNGREWKSRAAHIFRCRPNGSGIEPVMTGGMDNPVDVVFSPEGERLFSSTFLIGQGRRDGLVHAIYGGLYGKEHSVLDGHPRTGELMPALELQPSSAPSGLERYDSTVFGDEFRDNLFMCQFNLRKVSRHVLTRAGSTYANASRDFVVSDHVDFHPTDVLADADGSLLVVDTGGWYKLCCPTSQLWKPDALGAIYRVRLVGAAATADPRGRKIAWESLDARKLWTLLADARLAVRQRAAREFYARRDTPGMADFLAQLAADAGMHEPALGAPPQPAECDERTAALARAWAIAQLESDVSRSLSRELLDHADESVRQAAMHAASLQRDTHAAPQLLQRLAHDTAANRRVAAEALGRLGDRSAVAPLLAAAAHAEDRILEHSIAYALIELADPAATAAGLASVEPRTVQSALVAIDQMPGGGLSPEQVIPRLASEHEGLRRTARWIAARRPAWGGELTEWFRQELAALPADDDGESNGDGAALETMLVQFASQPSIERLLAETIAGGEGSPGARRLAIRAVGQSRLDETPPQWIAALAQAAGEDDSGLLALVIDAARRLPTEGANLAELDAALAAIAADEQISHELRVGALAVIVGRLPQLQEAPFALLLGTIAEDSSVSQRSAAADAIAAAPLSPGQLGQLCDALGSAGPLELNRLLPPFQRSTDDELGLKLLAALKAAPALPSLRLDLLRESLAKYGPNVQAGVDELELLVNVDAATQRQRVADLMPLMTQGDARRGHAVFHTSKAACSACHQMGYAGGTVGPELTRIGEIRTERDLLEAILYPSASFVRSYEPAVFLTTDGRALNGVISDQTAAEYVLTIGADKELRLPRAEVDEVHPSAISIMPAGIDQQLSNQELADLVAFLKTATGR